jgi:diguanylate cyclase (GGDEF)-like protein
MVVKRLSMRAAQIVAVVAMGAFGILLIFFSGEVYRQLAIDIQRETLSDYLRAETQRRHEEFELRTNALIEVARNDPVFVKALKTGRPPMLVQQLDSLLRSTNTSLGDVRITKLYLLDAKYKVVAASSLGKPMFAGSSCIDPIVRAAAAPASSRSAHQLCIVGDRPYYIAAQPVGVRDLQLYVAGEMTTGLAAIEYALRSPLRLRRANGPVIYQSTNWPNASQLDSRVIAEHAFPVFAPNMGTWELALAKDMTGFFERVTRHRYLVFSTVLALTAIAVLIVLFAMEHSAFKPLRALTNRLRRVREDSNVADEPIDVRGDTEVSELAEGINDMTARLREMYVSLEHQAFTDGLTELPNRSLFQDRLQQAILNAQRESKPFVLFFLDLDRFKDVNDTLGHRMGDLLLTQVAQRLRSKMRASDTVARMGGDEFAVLLPVADAKHASTAARMLLQALRTPFTVEEHNLNVSASIGIVMYPDNGGDAATLMQRADVAMYAAKDNTDGFTFYDPTLDQNYPTRLTLLSDLRQAVEHEEFELFYQPVVSLAKNRVVGVEALARWRHPRDGMLVADRFIPALEQSGLIHGLMPWVVSEALKCARGFELKGLPLTVSLNISMRDLQDPHIAESFAEQLAAHDVSATSIAIEITESAIMTHVEHTLELLSKLSNMGITLVIDDFGTGYSSMTYLKKLPVHTLKIDKSFVIGMTSDENDATIVRTSIDLAHNLGLRVVAEGVETEATFNQLKALGCDLAQGHYLGHPLTLAELDAWLTHSPWGFGSAADAPRVKHA